MHLHSCTRKLCQPHIKLHSEHISVLRLEQLAQPLPVLQAQLNCHCCECTACLRHMLRLGDSIQLSCMSRCRPGTATYQRAGSTEVVVINAAIFCLTAYITIRAAHSRHEGAPAGFRLRLTAEPCAEGALNCPPASPCPPSGSFQQCFGRLWHPFSWLQHTIAWLQGCLVSICTKGCT